ncbi:tagaturonate reductase [Roseateles sp. BYS78W]|uniref:Tagaturonate reductase n=1 Tax=Pelomonas candidula TaxID=3299025 RepID=A0ABW7HHH0_9BURK
MTTLQRTQPSTRPVRVLQFGQGNFLRGFVDWYVDVLNERTGLDADVVIVRPTTRSTAPLLDTQGGLYTTLMRGLDEAGQVTREFRRIGCVQREIDLRSMWADYLALAHNAELRFVVSNTTEAGIAVNDSDRFDDAPPASFPAKLTRWLHERYEHFGGSAASGLVFLPCELIDDNGPALQRALLHFARLWQLPAGFADWLLTHCSFCSTLVDRIVTGHPTEEMAALEAELGYRDDFLVAGEHFNLFVIQGPASLADELKLAGSGLNIRLVDDIKPYKQRKVGILNGAHTTLVPVALLAGLSTVGEAVADAEVGRFLREAIAEEIIPALPLQRSDLEPFAADVLRRFGNPFIQHRLASIALNSWSKFAARVMPQLLSYQAQTGRLPRRLVLALAATIELYLHPTIELGDDRAHLDWFAQARSMTLDDVARGWLARPVLWGRDLNEVPGLSDALIHDLHAIREQGVRRLLVS